MFEPVGASVSIALIGAGAALLGSLFGLTGSLLVWRQQRKEKRRDELRAAYAEWFTTLDVRTFRETQYIVLYSELKKVFESARLTGDQRSAAMVPLIKLQQSLDSERDQPVPQESSAFARLMIIDGRSDEFAELDRIRKISPFMSSNPVDPATGNYVPNIERFWQLEKEQAIALGRLAVKLCDRFAK
jgi:hypothetical protein